MHCKYMNIFSRNAIVFDKKIIKKFKNRYCNKFLDI